MRSHPTRVRGLKPWLGANTIVDSVAPHTGSWIETNGKVSYSDLCNVAPHTGAWIETCSLSSTSIPLFGRTPHGCVDWNRANQTLGHIVRVAPHTGAWIETQLGCDNLINCWSHPTRVRGLKPSQVKRIDDHVKVAPHTGAWIETMRTASMSIYPQVAPHTGAWIETWWILPISTIC